MGASVVRSWCRYSVKNPALLSLPSVSLSVPSWCRTALLVPVMLAGLAAALPAIAADGDGGGDAPLRSEVVTPPDAAPSPAGRLDHPRRRPGLWEIRNSASEQLGLEPVKLCVGDQTDTPEHHLDRQVGKRGACTLGAFRREGLGWVADSVCRDTGRSTIISQSTVSGDLQSHYRIDTVVFYSPPLPNNRREDREYTEARWLRACPSNQKPADLTIPGMGVLNMLDGGLRPESPHTHE